MKCFPDSEPFFFFFSLSYGQTLETEELTSHIIVRRNSKRGLRRREGEGGGEELPYSSCETTNSLEVGGKGLTQKSSPDLIKDPGSCEENKDNSPVTGWCLLGRMKGRDLREC